MAIPSIITNNFAKALSGLGNNSDSIIPMAVKDVISDCATVDTYRKEGGKDDAREKAIEEFGTGAVWLFGIPTIKTVIDKLVYPIFNLKPDLDVRIFDLSKEKAEVLKQSATTDEKKVFDTLKEKCKLFNQKELPFTNKQMYKALHIGKFLSSTAICAVLLSKIIKYKQKTTEERIKKEINKPNNISSSNLSQEVMKEQKLYNAFLGKNNQKSLSFTGASDIAKEFMFNPILNTSLLDGVITLTRLKEARKGEKKEVLLKELFQLSFIYGIAKPVQKLFEAGGKLLKMPIELDPKIIFDKDVKSKIAASKDVIEQLKASKDLTRDLYKLDPKSAIVELLNKNGVIPTIQKNGVVDKISTFKIINENDVKQTLNHLLDLQNSMKNIKAIKAYKTLAVIGNVIIASIAMGIIQPKVNILMRKKLNNGDNRNPAIVAQELAMQQNKIA